MIPVSVLVQRLLRLVGLPGSPKPSSGQVYPCCPHYGIFYTHAGVGERVWQVERASELSIRTPSVA